MKNIAKFISTLGNPLPIGLLFTIYYYLAIKNTAQKPWLVLLTVAGLLMPLLGFVIYKVRKGDFADYDVSNRLKRKQVYLVFLVSLFILICVSFMLNFPINSIKIQGVIFLQVGLSYLINQKLKISMHTSFGFLFAFLFFPLNCLIAWLLYGFGFLIGGSRLVLNRHKPTEVFAGFVLGNAIGLLYLYSIHFKL